MDESHGYAHPSEVVLHYVEAGDPEDPLVVLLHGFPEFWYAWRHQIHHLAAAGYHVFAPDMRGYNRSSKPPGIESYRLTHLTGDVVELIRGTEHERATVVGHDWGGVVAWELAHRHPEVLHRLAVCNAPHLDALARELRSPRQLRRSWYAGAFQVPKLPELFLDRGEYGWLRRLLEIGPTTPEAFSAGDIQRYRRAIARPGALRAALNYYRALVRTRLRRRLGRLDPPERATRTDVPTLLIWGDRDAALGVGLTRDLDRWVSNLRIEHLPEASHWVQNDAPDRVNDLLCDFLEADV
jgi:epoxide hydrolase 4